MSAPSREIVVDETPGLGLMHVLYLLHALAPFTMWTLALVAVIIGAVKRDDYRGTWTETHISWLSRTFWWGLLWILICGLITFLLLFIIADRLAADLGALHGALHLVPLPGDPRLAAAERPEAGAVAGG